MFAIVKFRDLKELNMFIGATEKLPNWSLESPINKHYEGCIRILVVQDATEDDIALYKYLRDLGAFEEVELK